MITEEPCRDDGAAELSAPLSSLLLLLRLACSRCRSTHVKALTIPTSTILWWLRAVTWGDSPTAARMSVRYVRTLTKCCHCVVTEIRLHSRDATELTRTEQLAYLCAEHARLLEQLRTLRSEFEELRRAHPPQEEWTAYCQRIEGYKNLLANHCIALEWTRYPPCGRTNVPSPLRHIQIPFCAPSQAPCALVAQEDETANLAVA